MSREQLTEQTQQSSEAQDQTNGDVQGLPPYIYQRVMALRPGDVDGLQSLLWQFDFLSRQIVEVASANVGMSTVKEAMRRLPTKAEGRAGALGDSASIAVESSSAVGRANSVATSTFASGGVFELEGDAVARPNSVETAAFAPGGKFELEGESADSAPIAAAEPAWVGGARAYNAAHSSFVDEFNDLTKYKCTDGGALDPQMVAGWQRKHGLDADGKVGPHTVAVARQISAKEPSAVAINAPADARPDV